MPIVAWETGRFLPALYRALDPVVLEVGTASGYSTLHMAEQLERGRLVTLERDPDRAAQARGYLETGWSSDSLAAARLLNSELLRSDRWLACVLAVGDGIGLAARRG